MDNKFIQVLDKHLSEFSEDDQKTCKADIEKYAKDIARDMEECLKKGYQTVDLKTFYLGNGTITKVIADFSICLANAILNHRGISIRKIRYRKVHNTNYINLIATYTDYQFNSIDRIMYWCQGYTGYRAVSDEILTN